MTSFRCYDNSDVLPNLIITNFHLYPIQPWGQFFQIFVHGDVVYTQTWEVMTPKNCIEPPYRSIGVRLGLITERSIDYAGIKEQITRAKEVPRNEA